MCEIKVELLQKDSWKIAHILKFHYPIQNKLVGATCIYLRPFKTITEEDDIDVAIIKAIENEYGEVSHTTREYVFKLIGLDSDDILAHYLKGGAHSEFVVYFIPKFPYADSLKYEGQTFESPRLNFNLSLLTNDTPDVPKLSIVSAELPIERYDEYMKEISHIETM